jgi:hypothetical protein
MPLLDLANDVLLPISESDISAFAQVNHHLYSLLNASLYLYNLQQFGSSALL